MNLFVGLPHVLRLIRAGFILGREGVFLDVDPGMIPPTAQPLFYLFRRLARSGVGRDGERLPRAMARLGPSYVKLGQFLATRPDVVGVRTARSLEKLQDRMAPFSRAGAVAIVERSLGQPIGDVFAEFSDPVAAASIAQVHKARRTQAGGGQQVAVKILRPGVEARFRRDLGDMLFASRLAERSSSEARRLRLVEVVETLARGVRLEMDFRLEAAAASEFADNTKDDTDFRAPTVDWNLTARDVLVTEWIDGTPMSDLAALRDAEFDLPRLGRNIIQSFLRHALRDGFFHADMHQGNLFVDPKGRIVAVDFGIMGRLNQAERRFLAEILYGFIVKDYRRVAQVHFDAGYVPKTQSVDEFAQAIRAVGEPIHSRTADQISMAKVLTLLFEITALFDMSTRTELVLLQKTMVVVEGVGRTLDPALDMWKTAEPVVRSWIEDNLGPAGKMRDAGDTFNAAIQAIARAPQMFERIDALSERLSGGGSRIEPHFSGARVSPWIAAPLWLLAAAALVAVLK
ncbi:MAG: 2-polyprenylphenol 6-hydroxylase [Hyphomicrobiales bacterium]|nr:2-polyprenylphenol 6-hydroxylase [Hyphomicrobiales bacterium]